MTEQLEDDFWAQERARAVAERGQHADPAACGTCKTSVAAGGQVEHDECAQRATLLPAPDAPGYELITGMSEEEVWALPARFHTPAFIESSTPKVWVCAVCWGDGWSTQWPCKTATEQGLNVFTSEDYAESKAKRDAADLAEHRAEAATPLVVDRFDVAMEAAPEEELGLTIGAVADDGRPVALVFDGEARLKVAGWLTPVVELEQELAEARARIDGLEQLVEKMRDGLNGHEPPAPDEMPMDAITRFAVRLMEAERQLAEYEPMNPQQCPAGKHADWLIDSEHTHACPWCRVSELGAELAEQTRTTEYFDAQSKRRKTERDDARAELAKYVGAEPTIAEEMAYLGACLRAVDALSLPENLKVDTITADYRNGYIHALADMRTALEAPERTSFPPAFPWAALMDDEDLAEFLAELEHAIAEPGATPDEALAEVEEACGTWRLIAETQHAHNTAAGPDAATKAGEDQ